VAAIPLGSARKDDLRRCRNRIGYTDGDWQKNPFYALRAGVQFPLGGLALDGYASYRLQKNKEIEDITGEDLDSITFAALLRFGGGSK
jgi:hypothetical protein